MKNWKNICLKAVSAVCASALLLTGCGGSTEGRENGGSGKAIARIIRTLLGQEDTSADKPAETEAAGTAAAGNQKDEVWRGIYLSSNYEKQVLKQPGWSIYVPLGYTVYFGGEDLTARPGGQGASAEKDLQAYISSLTDDIMIIPEYESFQNTSIRIFVKTGAEKRFGDITLREGEANENLEKTLVRSLGGEEYGIETLEDFGLRYIGFEPVWQSPESGKQTAEREYRYVTILDGRTVYVYARTGDVQITERQKSVLKNIALSLVWDENASKAWPEGPEGPEGGPEGNAGASGSGS